MLRKLDICANSFQKWVHIEEILIKLNVCFLVKDEKLLEKYNEIWKKVRNITKKDFGTNAVYNEKYIKKLKQNLIMEKSTQIFTIIKYQKKALNVFYIDWFSLLKR